MFQVQMLTKGYCYSVFWLAQGIEKGYWFENLQEAKIFLKKISNACPTIPCRIINRTELVVYEISRKISNWQQEGF